MPDLKHCEYILLEYAPSPLRETRIAVGLFLFEPTGRLLRQGFATEWRHLRCSDPQADISMLENLAAHFRRLAEEVTRGPEVSEKQVLRSAQGHDGGIGHEGSGTFYKQLRRMHEEGSGGLQLSAPRGVLTANPEREFEVLFEEHIAPRRASRKKQLPREGGRQWIHAQICDALRRHRLWDRITRDVPVAEFTAPADGFHIDFSYRPNGVTKYLHAISLERDWNQAKLLSYTFWRIREKSKAQMTAIVADQAIAANHPLVAQNLASVAESRRAILAGAQIALQPLSGIDAYLKGVCREIGVS